MKALHIPSKQEAQVIGYHYGHKAHLVRLSTGEEQLWKKEYVKTYGANDMTSKILMKITGGPGKNWRVIERVFNTTTEACEYLSEMTRLEEIKNMSKCGKEAKLTNGWSISCNHSISEILENKPPQKELSDWYPFDLNKKMKKPLTRINSNYKPEDPTVPQQKKKPTGKVVKLQDLTNDGRKARVVLRQLVRQKKIVKPSRWEWEAGSQELEIVKKALNVK